MLYFEINEKLYNKIHIKFMELNFPDDSHEKKLSCDQIFYKSIIKLYLYR